MCNMSCNMAASCSSTCNAGLSLCNAGLSECPQCIHTACIPDLSDIASLPYPHRTSSFSHTLVTSTLLGCQIVQDIPVPCPGNGEDLKPPSAPRVPACRLPLQLAVQSLTWRLSHLLTRLLQERRRRTSSRTPLSGMLRAQTSLYMAKRTSVMLSRLQAL